MTRPAPLSWPFAASLRSIATWQHRHLTVDAEDFGHLGLELRIAFFHRIGRRLLQIGQDNPRSLDTARRLSPRPRNLQQALPLPGISRQRDNSPRRYHGSPDPIPSPCSYQISPKMENQTQPIDISESLY